MENRPRQAVLIGTSKHNDPSLVDVPAARNSLERMRGLLRSPQCGWSHRQVEVFLNVEHASDLPRRLVDLFEDVSEVALFYFVGHGKVGDDDHLYLCMPETLTKPGGLEATSLPYEAVRRALVNCRARVKIVILDCCYAGMAAHAAGRLGSSDRLADLARGPSGTYVMAAAGAYDKAWCETPGPVIRTPMTSFTKHLAETVEHGIPEHRGDLRLNTILAAVRDRSSEAGHPTPTSRNTDWADDFIFATNVATFRASADHPGVPAAPDRHESSTSRRGWRLAAAGVGLAVLTGATVLAANVYGHAGAPRNLARPSASSLPTTVATAVVPAGGAVIDSPAADARVPQCVVVRGRSRLAAGKTLVLAVRNTGGATTQIFQMIDYWETPARLANWQGEQFLGSGAHGVGQHYEITVVIVDLARLRTLYHRAQASGAQWTADNVTDVGAAGDSVTVLRAPAVC